METSSSPCASWSVRPRGAGSNGVQGPPSKTFPDSRKVKSWKDLIFNIVDLAKVEDEVISVDFVAIFEVGTADIFVRGVWEEVMWGALWDR